MCASPSAYAHGAADAAAHLTTPEVSGVVAQGSYTVRWVDLGLGLGDAVSRQHIYFGVERPPPWFVWGPPKFPPGTLIAGEILDTDPTNAVVWALDDVPSGAYWLWSRADDPDVVLPGATLRFSPFPLIVQHPGDPLHPSVVLTEPNSAFDYADTSFELVWEAFDPDGTGRVTLEAGTSTLGMDLEVIAQDLPADVGRFVWDTRELPEGDYVLRATLRDARGFEFKTYAANFVLVTHHPLDGMRPDAGRPPEVVMAGDAAVLDAGAQAAAPAPSGCNAAGAGTLPGIFAWMGAFGALRALRRFASRGRRG